MTAPSSHARTEAAAEHRTLLAGESDGADAAASARIEIALARRVADAIAPAGAALVLWDGRRFGSLDRPFTLSIHTRAAFQWLLADPQFRFGDAWQKGEITLDGDLAAFLTRLFQSSWSRSSRLDALVDPVRHLTRPRSSALFENIESHYNLGTDFYRSWLDEKLVYTCAYFTGAGTTLDDAQTQKLDLVCRKLALKAGESVLELGSGWGALAMHMAERYGVRVRSLNISDEQVRHARDAAARAGLSQLATFEHADWRSATGSYDVVVSVGMLEHVGKTELARFAALVSSRLHRSGRGLVHTIGRHRPLPTNPWIERNIFPGGYAPTLGEITSAFEREDLVTLDVENLRPHYVRTLDHWRKRFHSVREDVVRQRGEFFARTWDLYLASSRASFAAGWSQLFHIVFAHASNPDASAHRPHVFTD